MTMIIGWRLNTLLLACCYAQMISVLQLSKSNADVSSSQNGQGWRNLLNYNSKLSHLPRYFYVLFGLCRMQNAARSGVRPAAVLALPTPRIVLFNRDATHTAIVLSSAYEPGKTVGRVEVST